MNAATTGVAPDIVDMIGEDSYFRPQKQAGTSYVVLARKPC